MTDRSQTLLSILWQPWLVRLGVIAMLLVGWEIVGRYSDAMIFAPPSRVFPAVVNIFRDPGVVNAVVLALWELLIAFAISVLFGLLIGLAVGLSPFCRGAIYPIVLMLYSVPQAPLLPIFILIFGIGAASKIAFGVSHGIFPVIITVAAGVQNIDVSLVRAARSMGASQRQILTSIVFPFMIPSFFTGMRLAMTGVLLGVLLSELFVSIVGIGFYTRRFADSFQPQNLFALIFVLAAIAVTLNELCRRAELRFSAWIA